MSFDEGSDDEDGVSSREKAQFSEKSSSHYSQGSISSRSSFVCNYDERVLLDIDEDGKSNNSEEDLFVDAISKE